MSNQANRNNKVFLIIVIVVVILGGLTAAWYWGMYKPEQEAKEKARQEQLAKAAAEKKRKEQAAQKKAKYEKLISDGDAELNNENWETAYTLYSEASTLFPNESYPQDQLTFVNAQLDEIAQREAIRAAGVVETVDAPTGRFYVIISSSIDGDLAMDYASKLVKEGTFAQIIAHEVNELPFYGVAVADYASWDEAVSASQSLSGFESGGWVLKY